MTLAAAHWVAFAREVAKARKVWTIRDDKGFPAPRTESRKRSQPFWSSCSGAEKIITVAAYSGFRTVEIPWEKFRDEWVKGLNADGILVGVIWSGKKASGYDIEPGDVLGRVNQEIRNPEKEPDLD